MTSHQKAAVIACRVLALCLALTWLESLPLFFHYSTASTFSWSLLLTVPLWFVPFLLAAVLWVLAPRIARRMLADVEDNQAMPSAFHLKEVQIVAVSVLGLLFIFRGLPGVVVVILEFFRVPGLATDPDTQHLFTANVLKALIMRMTEIGFGAWLFLGARSFVRVFERFNPPEVS